MNLNPTLSEIDAYCSDTGENPADVLELLFLARQAGGDLFTSHPLEVVP